MNIIIPIYKLNIYTFHHRDTVLPHQVTYEPYAHRPTILLHDIVYTHNNFVNMIHVKSLTLSPRGLLQQRLDFEVSSILSPIHLLHFVSSN